MKKKKQNRKKLHELLASPLFIWVLVKRMHSKTESHCTYDASWCWGGERKGEQQDQKRQRHIAISEMRMRVSAFKKPNACRAGYEEKHRPLVAVEGSVASPTKVQSKCIQ